LGASAVLVIAAVVGNDLETLLDAGTVMGTEVMVEVHTPNELEYALSKGATIFLINMWDRFTGKLFSNQVSFWTIFSEWGYTLYLLFAGQDNGQFAASECLRSCHWKHCNN
jgi:hypothetical protein